MSGRFADSKTGKDIDDLIKSAKALNTKKLDLCRRKISEIPVGLLELDRLEFIYLEGNVLASLPDDFFACLTSLKWLDLRKNNLEDLPSSIGEARNLRSLLLDDNKLERLPAELGLVRSLSGLHVDGNPLEFPPPYILEQGTQVVLAYLREHVVGKEDESEEEMALKNEASDEDERTNSEEKPMRPVKASGAVKSVSAGLRKKDKIEEKIQVEMEMAERRTNNDRINTVVQKHKDKQQLQDWRKETQKIQRQKNYAAARQGIKKEPLDAPFGTANHAVAPPTKHGQQVKSALEDLDRDSLTKLTRDRNIIDKIDEHIKQMRNNRPSRDKLTPAEQVEATKKNLQEALKLQRQLEERKALEYRLRAFTAEDYAPPSHSTSTKSMR